MRKRARAGPRPGPRPRDHLVRRARLRASTRCVLPTSTS
jgi:hypothetical protein